MAGEATDVVKLNHTLERVVKILHDCKINDWFIMFGTLLGIVRENSCIQGDDDIDIMINCDYQQLRDSFEKEGFIFTSAHGIRNSKMMLKSESTEEFGSFDFYFCEVSEGDYYTPWHKVKAVNCLPLSSKNWRSVSLNLPNDYLNKIITMYGSNWKTPRGQSCRSYIDI